MRVAVVNLTGGGLSGGYVKYLQRLIPLLREDPRVDDLRVYLPEAVVARLTATDVSPFETWDSAGTRWNTDALAARVDAARPDVVFVPTARIIATRAPTAVMVRNMEPLTAPFSGNTLPEAARNLVRLEATRTACRRASRVIAVSEFVRAHVQRRWRVPDEKLSVVPHGVDGERDAPELVPEPLAHGAPRDFLFTAGSVRPARGLEDVITALGELARRGLPHHLVIAGAPTAGSGRYLRRMQALTAAEGVRDRVHWVGHLAQPQMRWCFRRCAAFVMTSRMEACPNLVLESMAHGCVSISSTRPPMPEFYGGAAGYYESGDGRALAGQALRVLDPGFDTARMREEALARSGTFTWRATADRTIRALQDTIGAA